MQGPHGVSIKALSIAERCLIRVQQASCGVRALAGLVWYIMWYYFTTRLEGGRHGQTIRRPRKALRKPGRYGDGDGLYLTVRAGGSKSWILRAIVDGRRTDIGLGGYPATGLAQARAKARELKSSIADGMNPVSNGSGPSIPTFAEATRLVLEMNRPRWKSEKHVTVWLQSLERHAMPKIGNKGIDRIDQSDVLEVLKPIWTETPETARRVRQRMRTVFRWAMSHKYIDHNPGRGGDRRSAAQDAKGEEPPSFDAVR